MKIHLLSAKKKRGWVSTRWIDNSNTVYEIALEGSFDGQTITLDAVEEVLYVPPYGTSSVQVDLSRAKTTESLTKRGDRLVKITGGIMTVGEVVIKRRPPVPKLTKEPEAEPELDNTTVAT